MPLTDPVSALAGVGLETAKKLGRLGVVTIFDLLYHLPYRYEDRTKTSTIANLKIGQTVSVAGKIESIRNAYTKSGKVVQEATLLDSTGSLPVIWFNQSYLARVLKPGMQVSLYGKADFWGKRVALISPDYEVDPGLHTQRIVSIYPETAGLSSKWLRGKISALLRLIPEDFIDYKQFKLLNWKTALENVHFPKTADLVTKAVERLALDELLLLQLAALIRRREWQQTKLAHRLLYTAAELQAFVDGLPFALTPSQKKVLHEITADLGKSKPMNRLLIGDVGSGKTVIAAVAAYVCQGNKLQTVFLAPTQVLAEQHYATLMRFLPDNVRVTLVTSRHKLNVNHLDPNAVIVGTHAILANQHLFDRVGLVVVDEQHKFGVLQRNLAASLGKTPHVLTMTATPIPRTVALAKYGELDLSVLENRPGKTMVKTWLVPESKRLSAYAWVSDKLRSAGGQLFYVCPFIEESETQASVKAATTQFEHVKSIFPQARVGLLHGRLKPLEKQNALAGFKARKIQVLVTTSIIEVGLDIPNANMMMVESADRFGLATLHQLRGRIGRGQVESYCLLFSEKQSERLKYLQRISDGPQLAELDLKLRGAGDLFGTAQAGAGKYFRVAGLQHLYLTDRAKSIAHAVLPKLVNYPVLQSLISRARIAVVDPN